MCLGALTPWCQKLQRMSPVWRADSLNADARHLQITTPPVIEHRREPTGVQRSMTVPVVLIGKVLMMVRQRRVPVRMCVFQRR